MSDLPPLPLIGDSLFIDNSGFVEPMIACGRKTEYSFLRRRISAGEKSALNFGSAQHLVKEYRYSKYPNEVPDLLMEDEQQLLLAQYFEEHPAVEDDFRTLNWAVECNHRYNEKYSIEPFQLLRYDEPIDCPYCQGKGLDYSHQVGTVGEDGASECLWCRGSGKRYIMCEMSFALPLFTWHGTLPHEMTPTHIPIFYSGRIDLPVLKDSQLFVSDFKHVSRLGPTFWHKARMDPQPKGYCWSFEKLTGRKVTGYGIDATRVMPPPKKLQNGNQSDIEKWWDESLAREWFLLKDGELDEWKDQTIELVERFFWHYIRGRFPMEPGNPCTMWGQCEFYDICTLEPSERLGMLGTDLFTDKVWSPLKPVQINK